MDEQQLINLLNMYESQIRDIFSIRKAEAPPRKAPYDQWSKTQLETKMKIVSAFYRSLPRKDTLPWRGEGNRGKRNRERAIQLLID